MVAIQDIDFGVTTFEAPPAVRLFELEERLERGLRLIDQRVASGLSVERHEQHWIDLLAEYELLFDSLN